MIIALDFDETYTADPVLFTQFAALARKAGHTVIVATMRYEHEGDEVSKELGWLPIHFTGRKAKRQFLASKGIHPDVWIDDNPAWILHDAMA